MVQTMVGHRHRARPVRGAADAHVGQGAAQTAAGPQRRSDHEDRGAEPRVPEEAGREAREKEKAEEKRRRRRADEAGQGEGRQARARRRHAEGHHHPQGGEGRPAREGPEDRPPRHHRQGEGARARACRSCSPRTTTSSRRWPAWRAPSWSPGAAPAGLSTSGSGPGGGGTGYGHIYGAGNLDTGGRGSKGHGRGPKLAERGEHEVSVGMGDGGGDTDGSLSKEQINKVVQARTWRA